MNGVCQVIIVFFIAVIIKCLAVIYSPLCLCLCLRPPLARYSLVANCQLSLSSVFCRLLPVACSRLDYHLFCSIWQANAKWVDELSLLFLCLSRECVDSAGYFCEFRL